MKNKSKSSGKKREDRAGATKAVFDPVSIDVKAVLTCKLLLTSSEQPVVVKALSSIDKYAIKSMENLEEVCQMDITDVLITLISNADIFIRRFSTKLLAEMSALERVKKLIAEREDLICSFVDILKKETDVIVQEFCSLILAEASTLNIAIITLLNIDLLGILLVRITSPDPDVQKNSLQVIRNVLNDPFAAVTFIQNPVFSFKPIFDLFKSEYPVIQQLAISVTNLFTKQTQISRIHEKFRSDSGLQRIVEILEILDWKDLHHNLLEVLANCTKLPETAMYLQSSGCLKRLLQYMDKIQEDGLVEDALGVVINIANSDVGRQALFENQICEQLLNILHDESGSVTAAACVGISLMSKHRPAIDILFNGNPTTSLMAVLRSENRPWKARHAAAHAVHELLIADVRFCQKFVELRKQEIVLALLQAPEGKVPHETIIILIQIISELTVNDETRIKVGEPDLIKTLLQFLKVENVPHQIAACQALNGFVCESSARKIVIENDSLPDILKCLKSSCAPLKLATASLVQKLACNQKFVTAFIRAGALDWMLKNRKIHDVCPTWEATIEAIFKNYLPVKFALTGRLNEQDVTCEGFYITKCHEKDFTILDEYLEMKVSPLRAMYVANFITSTLPEYTEETASPKVSARKVRSSVQKQSGGKRQIGKVSSDITPTLEEQLEVYGRCAPDPYLSDYLSKVNARLTEALNNFPKNAAENKIFKEQIKIIAQFVSEQMAGPNPRVPCTGHGLQLHLNEIKVNLGTNIIPLGHIRVGSFLERALLFKVLADRISMPCALVRGKLGRAWIEVTLTHFVDKDDNDELTFKIPSRLLKPNYIVDLMINVGHIWPVGSYEAKEYCLLN